jgi:hypothetical protein
MNDAHDNAADDKAILERLTAAGPRPLHKISDEIARRWPEPSYNARPYIYAMRHLNLITDTYASETARSIVQLFLSNAGSWRGEDARRIKAELREMLKPVCAACQSGKGTHTCGLRSLQKTFPLG